MIIETVFYVFSGLILLLNVLPFVSNQHWFFRVWDFGRIQLLFILLFLFGFSFVIRFENMSLSLICKVVLLIFILYNCFVLLPYTPIFQKERIDRQLKYDEKALSIISVNVYQFNTSYHKLVHLIHHINPDIILTMESNADWEKNMQSIEKEYIYSHKATLENTYGMHFYSKLKIIEAVTHYFVADDIPSFEIILETQDGKKLTFFGVHPPPPSPTEEENSKERDGELLSVAKRVKKSKFPVIVSGDFNNVAWAKSSVLFKKISNLIDPRIGRGFVSTFHAKYKLLRFPIDLFFHSKAIYIEEFKTLSQIDSDHLPMFCKFKLANVEEVKNKETLNSEEKKEVDKMIEEGKMQEGNRDTIAKE
ncbi:conserved membrane hypothetical protein [Flavobacterium sp. 9AF]|uniref:endonuclease/exonuclease/phosphatase family protein n=1 Tax=Flavobacterium sp. 9AF TaxID=2653142 RepID=UPI0012F0E790|nr:endonuclease/exonuclease/phosphatase family protein [Flavobacterium sp. 9AF]VXC20796.1 conserved membrane hypothetical protein [Flavobacterium sp. 9AF]